MEISLLVFPKGFLGMITVSMVEVHTNVVVTLLLQQPESMGLWSHAPMATTKAHCVPLVHKYE